MSAVGDPEAGTDEDEGPRLWTSFATALRLIVGWFCVAIGALDLLAEVDRTTGTPDLPFFLFHAMLVIGGMVLLAVPRLRHSPGAVGCTAGATVAAAGLLISAIPATATLCCMSAFAVRHGFPFTVAARDDTTGEGGRWHIDSRHLLADLLFWGYAGLLVLVVVALARRVTHSEDDGPGRAPAATAADEPPPVARTTHAEHHAHARDVAADTTPAEESTRGTVGGLP